MEKYLFIAEKPSAMREIQAVYEKNKTSLTKKLGFEISFCALRGHLFRNLEPSELEPWKGKKWVELYSDHLPMIPSTWKLAPIDGAQSTINAIKDELKKGCYSGLIAGSDSDIEGYGIFALLAEALGLKKYKTLRYYEISMTEKDILTSLTSMTDFYSGVHKQRTDAFYARSHIDYLLGMNGSVLFSVRHGMLCRYGSVKAPLMKLIADNDAEVTAFVPHTSFGVRSLHTDGFSSVLLNDEDNKDRSYDKKEDAERLIASLNDHAVVKSFKREEKITKAPKLYALSDLQIEMAKHSINPDETLNLAQSLYEKHKILSYPRTSGNYLSSGKVSDLPDILASLKDIPELKPFVTSITSADISRVSADPNIINDKEVAKASHDALIPTGHKIDINALSDKERVVFVAVAKRLIAHFMPNFVEQKTILLLDNNGKPFKANGRKTIVNGFNDLYGKTSKDEIIPEYKPGDIIKIEKHELFEKVSQPPARYTTGTIIKAMKNIGNKIDVSGNQSEESTKDAKALRAIMADNDGLGTEATRATILKEIQDAGYINVKKNVIYITDTGKEYVKCIQIQKEDGSIDFGIAEPLQVAMWSARNKAIQVGEETLSQVMEDFYKYLNTKIAEVKASGDPIKRSRAEQASLGLPACPLCGSKVLSGKYGYYCSTYKESGCKLSIPNEMAGKKLTDNQKKGLLEGKKIRAKGFTSKAGKQFEADIVLNKSTGKVEFDFSNSQKSFPKKN